MLSELVANVGKSSLFCVGMLLGEIDGLSAIMGFPLASFLVRYLSLPLISN